MEFSNDMHSGNFELVGAKKGYQIEKNWTLGGFKNNETHCSCLASVPALETQAFFEEDNNKEEQREKEGC